MNTLSIDIGNSSIKVDGWANNGVLGRWLQGKVSVDEIIKLVVNYSIEGIIVSSVRKDSQEFIYELRDKSQCEVVDFNNQEIRKHYDISRYSGNIGPDRVAAYLGAEVIFPHTPKLVIDAGTAITLDYVDKEGNFCGGNISLGLKPRMKALAASTGRLPEIDETGYFELFGKDTATAIIAGARNGVKGETAFTIREAYDRYGIKVVVTTGGDAGIVYSPENLDILKLEDEYLVGRGLDFHLRTKYLNVPVGKIQI